jgi:membrane-associated phospholipid phosphatase
MGIGEYPRVGQSTQTRSSSADGALQPPTARPDDGLPILSPRPAGIATRAGERMRGHPVVAFVVVVLVGFAALAALTVLAGWLLKTYILPDHGIGHADEQVNVWLAARRTPTLNDVSFWLSGIGDVLAIPALVTLTALGAMVMRKWRIAAFIVAAIAIEAATYRVATLLIHRQRPHVHRLDQLPADASYYSGHTAASIAVYCGLALLITSRVRSTGVRIACGAIAIAIPLLVALSRMYRGMHHPTDVGAAVLVGIATLVVALTAARAAKAAQLAGEPPS